MSFRLRPGHRVFIFSQYVDLRAGFDRLALYVREKMGFSLTDGDLFIFMGKNRKKIKAICFDGTGLILLAKRLDRGCFMKLEQLEMAEITIDELDLLLSGGLIKRKHFGEAVLKTYSKDRIIPSIHESCTT